MHLRRRAVRVMMVMAVMEMRLHSVTAYGLPEFRSTNLVEHKNEFFDKPHRNFTSRQFCPTILPNLA